MSKLFAGSWWIFLGLLNSGLAAGLVPSDLRTEYLADAFGLEVRRPRLSWTLRAADPTARALRQTAYQIHVETGLGTAKFPRIKLWDSGEVASDATSQIEYAGPALNSRQVCEWSVRVRDQAGAWSEWSAPARWTMGLLDRADWSASWIGTGEAGVAARPGFAPAWVDNTLSDPWFRREFILDSAPVRATASVASVGFHELYVNGKKVGDAVLMPSVTDNSKRARYATYDLTGLLRPGRNVVGLWLGTGWSIFPSFATADKPRAPIVLAQFELELPDGTSRRIGTDANWLTHRSPSTLLGSWNFMNFGGESYDASHEISDWAAVGLDEKNWSYAVVFSPDLVVSAERAEPNRVLTPLHAVAIAEPEPGVYRVDMGRNFAGWIEAEVSGQPGDRVEFEFSEREEQEVTHRLHSRYLIGPGGRGVFRNRFNYSSGRWITIRGLRQPPALTAVRGWLVRTDFARAAAFESSDALLNQIYETSLWTLENLSLGGYVVDCPQRERMGYGGDAHATTTTSLLNFKTQAFYTKWAEDWRDVQSVGSTRPGHNPPETAGPGATVEAGSLPYTAPTYWGGGGPAWSGYCVHLPWEMYRLTGDRRILEENLPTIARWLDFLETKSSGDILRRWGKEWDFLGDWLWPGANGVNGDTRETLFFNNCYWIYSLSTAAKIARSVGGDAQAAAWMQRADQVRQAVHREFFNAGDSSYVNGFEAYLAIALLVDLPPAALRAAVWQRLEHEILVVRKGHIHAGITGGAFLFKTLMEARRDDLIYTMVSQKDYPGWGYLLRNGATTFGEAWDETESRLHSSYLYVGAWFIHGVLGIQPDASSPGFKRFHLHPAPIDQLALSWARGHYDSAQGRIEVSWRRTGDEFELEVTVPPNTSALVHLPSAAATMVAEGGKPLAQVNGIISSVRQGDRLVVEVLSGSYRFKSKLR